MKTECPFCNQYYEVDDEYLGQGVECPQCKKQFTAVHRIEKNITLLSSESQDIILQNTDEKIHYVNCINCGAAIDLPESLYSKCRCSDCGNILLRQNIIASTSMRYLVYTLRIMYLIVPTLLCRVILGIISYILWFSNIRWHWHNVYSIVSFDISVLLLVTIFFWLRNIMTKIYRQKSDILFAVAGIIISSVEVINYFLYR